MQVQIYDLNTRFNFGKHFGKSLLEVLQAGESRYIGWCIVYPLFYFILAPETIRILDRDHFFDDLDCSFPVVGGSLPINGLIIGDKVLNKEWIMNQLSTRYDDFKSNPEEYSTKAERHFRDLKALS